MIPRNLRFAASIALALLAAPALAGEVYTLTPEQRDAALFSAPVDPTDAAPVRKDRAIHGEMGVTVGTGGMRGVFGTALVPLGDSGMAALSFEDYRAGAGRRYRR